MATLMDLLGQSSSPIQKAEMAVKQDDMYALQPLLSRQTRTKEQEKDLVTEGTFVNSQAQETLLHDVISFHNNFGPLVRLNTDEMSKQNILLLFELLVATPTLLSEHQSINFWPLSEPLESPSHSPDCQNYPACLFEAEGGNELELMFSKWVWHRSHRVIEEGEEEAKAAEGVQEGGEAKKATTTVIHEPPQLIYLCRWLIRRRLVMKLLESAETADVNVCSYPQLVSQLPLPPGLHGVLAFRELWPVWPQHAIANLRRFPRTHFPWRFQHHPELVLHNEPDVWFPDHDDDDDDDVEFVLDIALQ